MHLLRQKMLATWPSLINISSLNIVEAAVKPCTEHGEITLTMVRYRQHNELWLFFFFPALILMKPLTGHQLT